MIQDIYPHRLFNQFHPDKFPGSDSIMLHFRNGRILCKKDESLCYFRRDELPLEPACQYLFTVDREEFFLCTEDNFPLPENHRYLPVRSLREMDLSGDVRHLIFAAYTAFQLSNWYRDNRFCGRCGKPTHPDHDERAIFCPECKRKIYPRILPAVIVGVTDGDRMILTKYADRPLSFFALVAGFNEIGESLEDTVRREVMEEVGLKVKNIRYYKSQPWGIVDDILAGFYCDVDGDPTIRLDRQELKEAIWVKREEIIGQPVDFSLTHEMMIAFREGKEPRANQ